MAAKPEDQRRHHRRLGPRDDATLGAGADAPLQRCLCADAGARHPDALGLPFRDAWPDIWEEIAPLVDRVFAGETMRFENMPLTMTRHGHPETWWNSSCSPVRDEAGAVTGLLNVMVDAALFRDVTESKRAEEALRKSEERHAFLVLFSDTVRGLTDPAAVATTACRMLLDKMDIDRAHWSEIDWKTEEFVTVGSVHSPGVVPIEGRFPLAAWEPYSASHREGLSVVVDDTQTDPRADSAMRAAAVSMDIGADLAAPVLLGGRLASVVAVKRRQPRRWTSEEIALVESIAGRCWAEVERARAEVALRDSNERFRTMADNAPALIWETDQNGATSVNRHYTDFFGVDADEVVGMGWANFLHPDDVQGYIDAYAEAFRQRTAYVYECRFRRADGQWRWLRNTGGPVAEDRFVGCSLDVTDLLNAQRAMRESEERQTFLLTLSDALRPLTDTREIKAASARALSERLGIASAGYAEVEAGGLVGVITDGHNNGRISSLTARYTLTDFGSVTEAMGRGETIHFADLGDGLSADVQASFADTTDLDPPRAATHRTRLYHRMVVMATRASSHRATRPYQKKYATVVLRTSECSNLVKTWASTFIRNLQ